MRTTRHAKTLTLISNLQPDIARSIDARSLAQQLTDCRCWVRSRGFCGLDRICEACNSRMRARRWRKHYKAKVKDLHKACASPVSVTIRLDARGGLRASKLEMQLAVEAFLEPFMTSYTRRKSNPLSRAVVAGNYGIQVDSVQRTWLLLALLWIPSGTNRQIELAMNLIRSHARNLGHPDDYIHIQRVGGKTRHAMEGAVQKCLNAMNGVWDTTLPGVMLTLHQIFRGDRRGGWFGSTRKLRKESEPEHLTLDPVPVQAVYIPRAPRQAAVALPMPAHAQAPQTPVAPKSPVAPAIAPKPSQQPQSAQRLPTRSLVSHPVLTPTQGSSTPRAPQAPKKITAQTFVAISRQQQPRAPSPVQPARPGAPAPRAPQAPTIGQPAWATTTTGQPATTLSTNRVPSTRYAYTKTPSPVSQPDTPAQLIRRPAACAPQAPQAPQAPTKSKAGESYTVGTAAQAPRAPRAPRPSTILKPYPPKAPPMDTDSVIDEF